MVAGIALFGVVSWGLLRVDRTTFIGGYVACSLLSGVCVHPISIGASPILHKQLSEAAKEIQWQYGEGLWACNDSGKAQYLLANGIACLNGVHHICNVKTWLTVDPEGKYKHIWNRYAHIPVFIAPGNTSWAELTENREDIVTWHLCKSDLESLGVSYLLWSGEEMHEPWAIKVKQVGADHLYRLISPDVRSWNN